MKRFLFVVVILCILLVVYILRDFEFAKSADFDVRYLGDDREIFVPDHPRSSIPPDVIFFLQDSINLIAISSDLSKQKGTSLKGREGTCTIFVTNLTSGERADFQSKEAFAKNYGGSERQIAQLLNEYAKHQC